MTLSPTDNPSEIGVVVPSVERVRAPLETAFGALGVPYVLEAPVRLGRTAFGHALLGLLRYAWLDAGRGALFAFLRSPYSGLSRARADFVEGRDMKKRTPPAATPTAPTMKPTVESVVIVW